MASGFTSLEGSLEENRRANMLSPESDSVSCEAHSDTAAVKFCNDHESAVCLACANYHHRTCKDIDDFEELSQKETKGKHVKRFVSELDQVVQKVERLKRVKNEDLSKLRAETSDALKAITEFRSEINWFLDKLERKGKMFIDKRYKEIHADIISDVEQCDTTLTRLDKLKKKMDNLEHKSQRLINIKVGKSMLTTAQRLCKEMKEVRPKTEFIKMSVDPVIERFVMKLRWYGKHRTYLSMQAPPPLPHLYKIKHDSHFDIRCRADKKICTIAGACQIKGGTILLIDSVNQNIKQVDVTYKIVGYCELPATPIAVCRTTAYCAAVLLEEQIGTSVHILTVNPSSLSLGESFNIAERCTGLAFSDGNFYVCTDTAVLIFSTSGEFVCSIYENASANLVHIHVSFHGEKLFVTDSKKDVIAMDTNGDDIETSNDASLDGPCGACTDRSNQVFVCCDDSHNVVQLSNDLHSLGELVDQKKGITHPQSVCHDFISNRLIVTQKSRNFIKVYQLE